VTDRTRLARSACIAAAVLLVTLLAAPAALAHTEQHIGDFHALIGWVNEPALAGQPNAVQLTLSDHDENPVTDVGPDDIKVVVSTGGVDSAALPLTPALVVDEGFGTPGEYDADLIPSARGDYTFHFMGTLHDTSVDLTVTSGPETFAAIEASSDLEFPVKQPTLTEVGTRLDRIDGRIEGLQAEALDPQQLADLQANINAARGAADSAASMAILVGGAGIVLAVTALVVGWRAGRRSSGPA
jgi:hypothetical protein